MPINNRKQTLPNFVSPDTNDTNQSEWRLLSLLQLLMNPKESIVIANFERLVNLFVYRARHSSDLRDGDRQESQIGNNEDSRQKDPQQKQCWSQTYVGDTRSLASWMCATRNLANDYLYEWK